MGLAQFAAFLGLADSALPGFWLANQIARKYYIINSIHIIIIIIVGCDSVLKYYGAPTVRKCGGMCQTHLSRAAAIFAEVRGAGNETREGTV